MAQLQWSRCRGHRAHSRTAGGSQAGRSVALPHGDRSIKNDTHREILRRTAHGLHQGDGGVHLHTFHPLGGAGSAQWFHVAEWLDFTMRRTGHVAEFTGRYYQTKADYDRASVMPVLDGKPSYEAHPVSFDAKKRGSSTATDGRRSGQSSRYAWIR